MIFDLHVVLRVALALVCAGVVSLALTPIVKHFAQRIGAMDVPKDDRRMHHTPIPRMGGLAIFIAFFLTALLFLKGIDRQMQAILLGAVAIVILGVFDDKYTLHALLKLVVQIGAACIVVFYGGCRIQYITDPFGSPGAYFDLGVFSIPLTIIWIVAITNAVNFIDGLDGLACGVSCITSVNLLVIALLVSEQNVALTMAALAGACLGFLPYNFNPAKIFMGDTGSTFLGFVLATVSIQGLFKSYAVISVAVPFLLLGLPIFDICFAVIRRLASGRNPMEADRGHFHHRLIDLGFSQKQSVAIAYLLTAILGLAGVLLTSSGASKTILLLLAVVVVGAIGFEIFFRDKNYRKTLAEERAQEQAAQEQSLQEQPAAQPNAAPAAEQNDGGGDEA